MTQLIDHLLQCKKIWLKSKSEYLTELINLKADPSEIEDLKAEIEDLKDEIRLINLKLSINSKRKALADYQTLYFDTPLTQLEQRITILTEELKELEGELNAS